LVKNKTQKAVAHAARAPQLLGFKFSFAYLLILVCGRKNLTAKVSNSHDRNSFLQTRCS